MVRVRFAGCRVPAGVETQGRPIVSQPTRLKLAPAPLPSKKRISFRSITIARLIPVPDYRRGRQPRRPFEGRKDGKAFAARLVGDGSLCVRRDGDSVRRPLLAVLYWRVTELGCWPTINPLRARSAQFATLAADFEPRRTTAARFVGQHRHQRSEGL